jgi:hypothetical protein
MRNLILILIGILFANNGLAETYVVKKGDILSKLVMKRIPQGRLYGPHGKLVKILSNNPQIKNPNLIYPNQIINFITDKIEIQAKPIQILSNSEKLKSSPPKTNETLLESKKVNRHLSFVKGMDEWNISALYGVKYLSFSQTGELGSGDLGVLFLNYLKVNSEFIFDTWSFGFQFDSYKFKYEALSSGDSKQIYSLNLYGSYKWIIGGFGIEESPLFKSNSESIEMTKMSLMYFSLGAKKEIELPTLKPTVIKLKGWLKYPFSSSTSNVDVELDSISGFGFMGQMELNRQIFTKEDYSLEATWMTQLGFVNFSQNVDWDTSVGEVKVLQVDASSTLGLLFKF